MKKLLFDLCSVGGVSGSETSAAEYCCEYLKKYTKEVRVDYNNNVLAVLGNDKSDKTVLLDAHLDRIGFIVTEINEEGFIKAEKCGGIDTRTLLDACVIVHGNKDLFGVVCCMPPHLSDGREDKAVSADNIWIDLGLPADKVKDNVSPGDSVSLYAEPKELINSRISASALDNRAGVVVLLKLAERIYKENIDRKVCILLSCQEETFATGAKTVPFDLNIDESVTIDVSFASQPGVTDQYSNIKLGKGPMLCVSPILNRDLFDKLRTICAENNIDYQLEVCSGNTGTNGDHIATSKSGVKTALVSIPQKNMHSQAEIVDLKDMESTVNLLSLYVKGGKNG